MTLDDIDEPTLSRIVDVWVEMWTGVLCTLDYFCLLCFTAKPLRVLKLIYVLASEIVS